jgi:hypothetical protein
MSPTTPCCFCGRVVDDDDVLDAHAHGVAPYCCVQAQENDEACDALEQNEVTSNGFSRGCRMKISAERLCLDNWTVTIDGDTRKNMTRDEAWSALDLAMSMSKTKEEGQEP